MAITFIRCLTMAITFLGGLKDNKSVFRTLVTIGSLVHDMEAKGRQEAEKLVTNPLLANIFKRQCYTI